MGNRQYAYDIVFLFHKKFPGPCLPIQPIQARYVPLASSPKADEVIQIRRDFARDAFRPLVGQLIFIVANRCEGQSPAPNLVLNPPHSPAHKNYRCITSNLTIFKFRDLSRT